MGPYPIATTAHTRQEWLGWCAELVAEYKQRHQALEWKGLQSEEAQEVGEQEQDTWASTGPLHLRGYSQWT